MVQDIAERSARKDLPSSTENRRADMVSVTSRENGVERANSGPRTYKVAPLVASSSQSPQETADNHENVEEERDKDDRQRQTGDEEQAEQQKGCGERPVDIATIPDLTRRIASKAATACAVVQELRRDGRSAEIASLRVPRNSRDGHDGGEQIVEDPPVAWHPEGPDEHAKGRSCHDAKHSPAPVTSPSSQVNVGVGRIDVKSSIARAFEDVGVHVEK